MDPHCIPAVSLLDPSWIPHGSLMDPSLIPAAFPLYPQWIPHGPLMDPHWIPRGSSLDACCIPSLRARCPLCFPVCHLTPTMVSEFNNAPKLIPSISCFNADSAEILRRL